MKRPLLLVAGVAAFVIGSKLLAENVLGVDLAGPASQWIVHPGSGSAIAVVLLLAIDLFLPVPSSVVMVLSGAAFGVLWGSLLSLAGSIGGEWLGFELVRHFGRGLARRLVDDRELQTLERVFDRYGSSAVLVSRALPIVMETMSVAAGLSTMPRRRFLLASLAGTAPIVVVYAYAGAVSREMSSVVPAIIILVAASGGALIWYRARASQPLMAATVPPPETSQPTPARGRMVDSLE